MNYCFYYRLLCLATIICFACSNKVSADVIINEFSAANFDNNPDNYGDYEDWVELYNTSNTAIDIGGYYLSDKTDNLTKWQFPAGFTIDANDFAIIFCSKRNETVGTLHTNFKITQTRGSENIILSDPNGVIVDINEIEKANARNHSWGRTTDGANTWSVFTAPTPNYSNNNETPFGGYAAKPDIDIESGAYPSPIEISITEDNPYLNIHYTLDGSTPTEVSPIVNGPIQINSTTVVKAISVNPAIDTLNSFVKTSTYFIDENHTIPIVSISGDNIMDLLFGSWDAEPVGFFEYFDENGNFVDESVGDFNKHGNDSWAYDQRGVDYVVRDQFGYDYAVKEELFQPYSDRGKFQRLMLKAAANDNYPEEDGAHIRDAYVHVLSQRGNLDLDERSNHSCILYANGDYWGVYEIREKADDHDYTEYYYDQEKEHLDYLKTWGGTWEEYGSRNEWDDLVDFITNNDMADQANFDYVDGEFNMLSFIDYYILNVQTVCKDWLNWNTAWWRGSNPDGQRQKWAYVLWDLDATFGHYINYTGVPDESPQADPCSMEDLPSDFEGHTSILTKLFDNETFNDLYVNRYADLNNVLFHCDTMHAILDEMLGYIAPEMQRQIDRWGGTMADYQNAIVELEEFIDSRCAAIDGGIVDCYDVEGPFEIIVDVQPANAGTVKINTIEPQVYPWSGDYFTGVDFTLEAIAAENYQFVNWEVNINAVLPSLNDSIASLSFTLGPDIIVAHFEEIVQIADTRLTVVVSPEGAGEVTLNGAAISSIPYLDYYFDGSAIELEVTPSAPNFVFETWQANEHALSPVATSPSVNFVLTQSDVVVAFFEDTNAPEPVGIADETVSRLNIYPNPASSNINVELDKNDQEFSMALIFNYNGNLVHQQEIPLNKAAFDIDLSAQNLITGHYVLQLIGNKNSISKKLVILK